MCTSLPPNIMLCESCNIFFAELGDLECTSSLAALPSALRFEPTASHRFASLLATLDHLQPLLLTEYNFLTLKAPTNFRFVNFRLLRYTSLHFTALRHTHGSEHAGNRTEVVVSWSEHCKKWTQVSERRVHCVVSDEKWWQAVECQVMQKSSTCSVVKWRQVDTRKSVQVCQSVESTKWKCEKVMHYV